MQKRKNRTRKLVVIALFAAISAALMYLEFSMGFLFPAAPFLKLDFSTVPILIGSFMYGPLAGITMTAIKSAIHIFFTDSMGIGQLTDFIITSSFAITAGLIYKRNTTKRGAIMASVASVFVVTIVGALVNYFIALPLYSVVMNYQVESVRNYLLFAIVPFNLLKGTLVALLTFLVYKRLSVWIQQVTGTGKTHTARVRQNP